MSVFEFEPLVFPDAEYRQNLIAMLQRNVFEDLPAQITSQSMGTEGNKTFLTILFNTCSSSLG